MNRLVLLVIPLTVFMAGCASDPPVVLPSALPSSSPSVPDSTSGAGASDSAGTDDLASGGLRHTVRSSGVTVIIDYQTSKPATPWTAAGEKPLRVEVRVIRPTKKVYLTRSTLRFAVDDAYSAISPPDPLVDTATNVDPGYLVTPPYSYVQSFAVPAVDSSTREMTIGVKLELVSLVDGKAKDYTKQTVTDSIQTVIAA